MADDNEYMLTTVDNPYNPFTQYDSWYWWDYYAGYHTPGALARVVILSDDLSDVDTRAAINQGIDEVVAENVLGVWKKVLRKDFPDS
jgi:hypothetical protein